MKKAIEWIGGICDALNALPLILLPIFGPFLWAYWLVKGRDFTGLLWLAILWLLSITIIAIEFRRGKKLYISLGLFLAWMVILTYVYTKHFA